MSESLCVGIDPACAKDIAVAWQRQDDSPAWACYRCPQGDHKRMWWILDQAAADGMLYCYIEKPFRGVELLRRTGWISYPAQANGFEVRDVAVQTWRSQLGIPQRAEPAKASAVELATQLTNPLTPLTDDEAEAICIAHYGNLQLAKEAA